MAATPGDPVTRNLPYATLSIALAAVAATQVFLIGDWFMYDRTAIADGEIWRLVTGHLYHYSWTHLVSNLLPFVAIGAWIEMRIGPWLAVGCLFMAVTIGASLFLAYPDMITFGGLSGIDCGFITYYGLQWWRIHGRKGVVGRIALIALFIKIGFEMVTGAALLANRDGDQFVVMPLSHVVGCLIAGLLTLLQPLIGLRQSQP